MLNMLSAPAEHALRAVLHLAQFPAKTSVPADRIAEVLGAPRNYLAKTLNALAKAGVVHSSRGPTGGFSLAIPPNELTVAAVVAPFDEQRRSNMCLLQNQLCDSQNPCSAHARWVQIADQTAAAFARTTIADLLSGAIIGDQRFTERRLLAIGA